MVIKVRIGTLRAPATETLQERVAMELTALLAAEPVAAPRADAVIAVPPTTLHVDSPDAIARTIARRVHDELRGRRP
jgi:hypothetical protein